MRFLCVECEFECEKQSNYDMHNESKTHKLIKRKIEEANIQTLLAIKEKELAIQREQKL